ncbi:MAG: SapC family protein [Sphingomicrobium sp.]
MAKSATKTAPNPPAGLPMFYNALEPVNLRDHGKLKVRRMLKMSQVGRAHAVPLTVDEFVLAQRHFPIVFSVGDSPVPLALMGLNDGVNVFIDEEGKLKDPSIYVPAYIRRYPFLLAKIKPDSDELSLCFDPSAEAVGDFKDGDALFADDKPTAATQSILDFCEQFESAGQRTQAFMEELKASDLLMDGEVSIQPDGAEQPFVYRGFRMIDEEKLRGLRGDELRKMNQNGMLPLAYAHLFSLTQMRDLFSRQLADGKAPGNSMPAPAPATA